MANKLLAMSQLSRVRSKALMRTLPRFTSLIPVKNNYSQLVLEHSELDPQSSFLPMSTSYSDNIIMRDSEALHDNGISKRDREYINYLKQQNCLQQQRMEWFKYNVAMKNCVDEIFHCSSGDENNEPQKRVDDHAKLYALKKYLSEHLRTFFVKSHNYAIYHKDIIFENNYYEPSRTFQGLNAYTLQLSKYRLLASLRYTHAKFDVLSITASDVDHSIRVRWRITGLGNMAALARFWRFFPGRYRSSLETESDWHDGYSTLYVNKDGLIVKHRVERVMPDEDLAMEKKTGLAAKLVLTLGFILGPDVGD